MGNDNRIDLYSLSDEELQKMHDDLVKEDRDYFMINLVEEELSARGLWEDDDYDEEEEQDYYEEDEDEYDEEEEEDEPVRKDADDGGLIDDDVWWFNYGPGADDYEDD